MEPSRTESKLRSMLLAQADNIVPEPVRPHTGADDPPPSVRDDRPHRPNRRRLMVAAGLTAAAALAVTFGVWQSARDSARSRVEFSTVPAATAPVGTVATPDTATPDTGTSDGTTPDTGAATPATTAPPAIAPPFVAGPDTPAAEQPAADTPAPPVTSPPTTLPPPCIEDWTVVVSLDASGLSTSLASFSQWPCSGPVTIRWGVAFQNRRTDLDAPVVLEGTSPQAGTLFSVGEGEDSVFTLCRAGTVRLVARSLGPAGRTWRAQARIDPPSTCSA